MKTRKSAASAALKRTSKRTTVATDSSVPLNGDAQGTATIAPTPVEAPRLETPKVQALPPQPKDSAALTTIEVKVDVGFGNAIYLRGQGSGLAWDHGVPLVCVDGKTWRWSQPISAPITFKVLLNDKVWSAGDDMVATPGAKVEVAPKFA